MVFPTVSVIIPAYNEEHSIGDVISQTAMIMDDLNFPYEIIIVDDGSTDKTRLIASCHKVTLLTNDINMGKGYSIRKALLHATGDIIVTIDSDGQHMPKEIPDLIKPLLNGTDVVSGSRFLGNNPYFTRRINTLGNFLFNTAIMALTGRRVTDSQTGFRAIKRKVIEDLRLESDRYEIETEITVKSLKNGFVFEEKPVSCQGRRYSVSRLKLMSDGKRILKTIIKSSFYQHKEI
jgi:glycosyltransferase involved in cell wall biosynthesis